MSATVTLDALLASLLAGDTVLLPTTHAAARLRTVYDATQRKNGLTGWQPAAALSWSHWTGSLFNQLIVNGTENRLLMNAAQEQSLWKSVIDADQPPDSLESSESLAELAASAMRLAGAWNALARVRNAAAGPMANNDTRIFANWMEEFQRRCAIQKLLPAAMLEATLARHIESGVVRTPPRLRLIGFQQQTPAERLLLEALRSSGVEVVEQTLVSEKPMEIAGCVVLDNPTEELTFVARWLRQTLEQAQNLGETPRVALIVPDLQEEHEQIEAELRNTLSPELHDVSQDTSSTPWHIASGAPLTSSSMIADALDIARWAIRPLPQQRITALLLSPYLGSSDQRESAAQLDALLRRKEESLKPEYTLRSFVTLMTQYGSSLSWPEHLLTEQNRSGELDRLRTYAEWMETIRSLVQCTGWPHSDTRALTATEFQATRDWDGVLDLVATLDFNGQRVTYATALQALELHTKATVRSSPLGHASVHVLSPEQAAGSTFDHVLFMHATDNQWPARERTHPLLPWQLQKNLGMPGTDPLRISEVALTFGKSLQASTPVLLFTHARSDADGKLRPSPVLAQLGLAQVQADTLIGPAVPAETLAYERVLDDAPLPSLRSTEFHGGATLLKLQAACGFLAYAQLRLNAGPLESSELGLDARQSGTLVHKVLHLFWQQVHDRDTLASYTESECAELLRICINRALAAESNSAGSAWEDAYLKVIQERLLRLLTQWLESELDRGPFEVIATELRSDIAVGPLQLRVQMDRIDNILDADGNRLGELYIDYKTGAAARPSQWQGDRPDEPQLPLYTLQSEPEEVMGVAFAKLRAGDDMRYAGLQAISGVLGRKSPKPLDLTAQIAEWRSALTQLAEDFASGKASVDPKRYPQTCKHCHHRLLCRVDPAALRELDEEEAEETDG